MIVLNLNRFVGKTVVITGSGSGIGKATALRFAEEGANIVRIGAKIFGERDYERR